MDRVGGAVLAPEVSHVISSDLPIQERTLPKNSKLDKLERILKRHSLEQPYRNLSGPSLRFQYTGKEKRYEPLVKRLNSELTKYDLRADLFYDNGVIEISPKNGPSRDLLVEYKALHPELFEEQTVHSHAYCTQ